MPRYANVDKLMEHAIRLDWSVLKWVNEVDICNAINPNVVERKKGKWKDGCCTECGYNWGKDAPIASVPNFCPNCGAKMKQETTANIKDDDISWTDLRWYLSKEEKEYD